MRFQIDPGRLELAKGELAAVLGRRLTYKEFAEMADVNAHTFSNIMQGHTGGSIPTAEKIVELLRRHGINWDVDFLSTSQPERWR